MCIMKNDLTLNESVKEAIEMAMIKLLKKKDINKNGGEILEGDYKFDIEVECDKGDVTLTFKNK